MNNGITNDESASIGKFIEDLNKINCTHEWHETENYYIKCKKCNKLKEYTDTPITIDKKR